MDPVINSRYIIGLDGISLPLIALTMLDRAAVHHLLAGTTSPSRSNPKAFLILILILETGMIGTFVAQDLILFFVFFEVVLLPMYFMIGVWGGEQRQYASIKFFLYTLFGSALMIVSFLALYFLSDKVPVAGGGSMHTFDMRVAARRGRTASRTTAGALDLRRHVHGLRHQGADVPVPHLAARRPHPGPHRRLGDPGRGAAEARHLRLHPHRPPDPARGGRDVGAVHRRCWR